jgi:hypothetical protein
MPIETLGAILGADGFRELNWFFLDMVEATEGAIGFMEGTVKREV